MAFEQRWQTTWLSLAATAACLLLVALGLRRTTLKDTPLLSTESTSLRALLQVPEVLLLSAGALVGIAFSAPAVVVQYNWPFYAFEAIAAGTFLAALAASWLARRWRRDAVLAASLLLLSGGLLALQTLRHAPYMVSSAVIGIGLGGALVVLFNLARATAAPDDSDASTWLLGTAVALGVALGMPLVLAVHYPLYGSSAVVSSGVGGLTLGICAAINLLALAPAWLVLRVRPDLWGPEEDTAAPHQP
jgi:hypothetical protein